MEILKNHWQPYATHTRVEQFPFLAELCSKLFVTSGVSRGPLAPCPNLRLAKKKGLQKESSAFVKDY